MQNNKVLYQETRKNEILIGSGVEYQIDSEHFQYISISNLNSIKESEIELEKVLLDYSLMVKNVVDYKL